MIAAVCSCPVISPVFTVKTTSILHLFSSLTVYLSVCLSLLVCLASIKKRKKLSRWYKIQFHKFIVLVKISCPISVNVNEWRECIKKIQIKIPLHINFALHLQRAPWYRRFISPKKSVVSQTALEGSHCDCENDWDLINSPSTAYVKFIFPCLDTEFENQSTE